MEDTAGHTSRRELVPGVGESVPEVEEDERALRARGVDRATEPVHLVPALRHHGVVLKVGRERRGDVRGLALLASLRLFCLLQLLLRRLDVHQIRRHVRVLV